MFRWFAVGIFVSSLAISAYRRRLARRLTGTIRRRQEPAGLIVGRLLVTVPLFGGVLAYLANPAWMDWSSMALPVTLRWAGVALGVLVVAGVHWVLTTLGANVSETVLTKPTQQLVTAGPYRWVRHPLYAVGVLLFVSVGLIASNWFILACAAVAATAIRLAVIPREEEALIGRFGDDYRRYRNGTGALVPRLAGTSTVKTHGV